MCCAKIVHCSVLFSMSSKDNTLLAVLWHGVLFQRRLECAKVAHVAIRVPLYSSDSTSISVRFRFCNYINKCIYIM